MAKDDIIISDFLEDEELEYGTKEYWEREKENEKKKEQYFGDEIEELEPWIDPYDKPDLSSEFGELTTDEGDVVDISDVEDDSWWLKDLYDYASPYAMDAAEWTGEKIGAIPEAVSNINLGDVKDVSEDLIRSQINALAGAPELLWNVAKLPVEGAIDFARGDPLGMGENIIDVLHTSNPLKYNKDDPYGLYEMAEFPVGIWAAKKLQNALYQHSPEKLKTILRNAYPYWTQYSSGLRKDLEAAYRSAGQKIKTVKPGMWNEMKRLTWPAIRGLGQYGLASTGIGAIIPAMAYAATAKPAGEGSDVVDQRPYGYVPGTRTWAPEGVDIRNPNEMRNAVVTGTSAPSNRAMMEMADTRRPGPRNNYQGL
tara:strand:+ start:77 stop:1180 length:1104 start_codon:yes stop_codon:yes gene_type:complete